MRGVAVLGILAINITGFWGPTLASFSPLIPRPEPGGMWWFAFAFVVFEGKMRALFTLLFGASLVLFCESVDRRGGHADLMQVRRLSWLALFGYGHYLLLWWGDILFPYALCGMAALALRRLAPVTLSAIALAIFTLSHGVDGIGDLLGIAAEQRVLAGHATGAEMAEQADMMTRIAASVALDTRVLDAGFVDAVRLRLATAPYLPLETTLGTLTETLPLMMIGIALHRTGFFTGGWDRHVLRRTAQAGIATGGAITLAMLGWLWASRFPPRAMFGAIDDLSALPHLTMAIGYAAALVLCWPHLRSHALGQRLAAAGHCAFTNYLGTTVVMTAVFSGWGLGLGPELPRAWLPAFVLLGWALMLAWPRWWLARVGQGPLEALWRRLTWLGVAR